MKVIKLLIAFSVLFLTNTVSYGQQVYELGSLLKETGNSSESVLRAGTTDVFGLVYEMKPTMYLVNGQFVERENGDPICIISDVSSLQLLNTSNPLFVNVKMICIKIQSQEDLRAVMDVSLLPGFENLKYIYFLCTFKICGEQWNAADCEVDKISTMLRGTENSNVKILYSSQNEN